MLFPRTNCKLWQDYWKLVGEVFQLIDKRTMVSKVKEEPTLSEIVDIIHNLDIKKASYGFLSIDLVKLGGAKLGNLQVYSQVYQA